MFKESLPTGDQLMRIAIVQYGVYHEAFEAFKTGGKETYYAQRYSVDFVETLSNQEEFVGVIGIIGAEPLEKALTPTLHSACIPAANGVIDPRPTINLLERWKPDRLILQAPSIPLLRWAKKSNIDCLPLLADSFEYDSIRERVNAFRLGRFFKDDSIRAIGNHNIPATLSLERIGVPAEKLFPWDWPHALRPENHAPKTHSDEPAHIVFIGAIAETKGVFDCIGAAKTLTDRGRKFTMTLIGSGDASSSANQRISENGLGEKVRLAGRLPHEGVIDALNSATISLAPSHHRYPEGLPMTTYEALATRTPLVVSDHPMFQLYFRDTPAATMVPEKDPVALADAIDALLSDHDVYNAASLATEALWNHVKCDLTWGDLITAWLAPTPDGIAGIHSFSLSEMKKTLLNSAP